MNIKEERIKGLMKLKLLVTKLQGRRFFSHRAAAEADLNEVADADGGKGPETTVVPNDVKKGHFAVVAVKGGKPQRFILDLDYLNNPDFMRLLEQAQEEYGFQQKGVLSVPCLPEELQDIVQFKRNRRASTEW